MFTESSQVYDLIYHWKDYAAEAERLRQWLPSGTESILDVACCTAEHHRTLTRWYDLDGIDLNPEFLEIAARKNPQGLLEVADMAGFDLQKTYDAVICLFSSIGYLAGVEQLNRCLSCMARHLTDEGVVIVEPWFQPEKWRDGRVFHQVYEDDGVVVSRVGRSYLRERRSVLEFDYLWAESNRATRHFREVHTMTLFTDEEMRAAFHQADLSVEFHDPGLNDRGLYVGLPR